RKVVSTARRDTAEGYQAADSSQAIIIRDDWISPRSASALARSLKKRITRILNPRNPLNGFALPRSRFAGLSGHSVCYAVPPICNGLMEFSSNRSAALATFL